ncbi:MAG TPA: cytochrome c oxidase subunit II [Bacteroidales bacterium]|nr:cytochrome c oxidase subunit II [Bacteroidales bacterium]
MYSTTGIEASNFAEKVDMTFIIILGICFLFLIGLTAIMIYFIIRYNRKRNPKATPNEGSTKLEIIWTIIPTLLAMLMFYFGWAGWIPMKRPPADARQIIATARMWNFSFIYDNGKTSDKLYVPINEPVTLKLQSVDVIHSFYIPAFRLKEDMVPGREKVMWFIPQNEGSYHIFCAEYCGLRHSYMSSSVEVLPKDEFEKWMADTTSAATAEEAGEPEAAGLAILKKNGCTACHSSDGSRLVGPSYQGIWGEQQVIVENGQEKTVTVDSAYIRQSIYDPNSQVVKGFQKGLMQPYEGVVTEDDLSKIIEYLKSLNE